MIQPWPNQQRALDGAKWSVHDGVRDFAIVAPTGGGKTIIMALIAKGAQDKDRPVLILTNRKILLEQASSTFCTLDIEHGLIASQYATDAGRLVQVASVQTLDSWVFKREQMPLPKASVVLVDEAHSNASGVALKIIEHYKAQDAIVIGMTATPVGLKGIYSRLVDGGSYSELRDDGRLVPCDVFAPSEPDMEGVKIVKGEFSKEQMRERVRECNIFGDIYDNWRSLNPFATPTVVFAPGVKESRHIVEDIFRKAGVSAEHVDADTEPNEREDIFGRFADGRLKVVSSFGVLREGWNAPCAQHGILAQPCASLKGYIQIAGRILRAHPGKDRATLQDHAGAFWRHGHPDDDRNWSLDDTDSSIAKKVKRDKEQGKEREPICCPKCSFVRKGGPKCPTCGFEHEKSVRHVRMKDGTLRKMTGPVVKQKRAKQQTDHLRTAIFQAAASGKTVGQMVGMFNAKAKEDGRPLLHESEIHGIYVPPRDSVKWTLRAEDVYPWANRRQRA